MSRTRTPQQLSLFACQRWRQGRDSYRPKRDVVDPSAYEVVPVPKDVARAFCLEHHYLGSWPSCRYAFGLISRGQELVGIAAFGNNSTPGAHASVARDFGVRDPNDVAVLSRFVLRDDVLANGETLMLGATRRLLQREGIAGFASYSDLCMRDTVDGRVVLVGHVGWIYAAGSAVYTGRTDRGFIYLFRDGTTVPSRSLAKIANRDRGWRGAVARLVSHGAADLPEGASDEERRAWLAHWLPRLTRKRRHLGNHRYLFPLTKTVRRNLPDTLPYPKFADPVLAA